jgi:hypothetical protein
VRQFSRQSFRNIAGHGFGAHAPGERGIFCHDRRRMCANCVANVDAAVAAVGGIAGIRMWLGTHVAPAVSTGLVRRIAIAVLLALVIGPFFVAAAIS